MTYYNENDPKAAQWLRNLIAAGLIPAGHVDDRSIADVRPSDLDGYVQCHFFAGIAGWAYALELAGWPVNRPVWTGSCPCQPFSSAGKRKGEADERHLWPEMHRLIAERRPATCFGEQVASDDGCRWLAGVFADLEALEYRVAGADLCAAGVGAPHIRQRVYWVGVADGEGREGGALGRVGDSGAWRQFDLIHCRDGKVRRVESGTFPLAHGVPVRVVKLRTYGNAIVPQVAAEFIRAFMETRPG